MATCPCRCHGTSSILITPWPDLRDVLAAVLACPACINRHCPALVADWPWPYIPRESRAPPIASADGYPYDATGEGAE